jgi:hypothetical protein
MLINYEKMKHFYDFYDFYEPLVTDAHAPSSLSIIIWTGTGGIPQHSHREREGQTIKNHENSGVKRRL